MEDPVSTQPTFLAPAPKRLTSLNNFLEGVVIGKLHEQFPAHSPYVRVSGYLGQFEGKQLYNGKYYGIPLIEGVGDDAQSIHLNISRKVIDARHVREGQHVVAQGLLSVRNRKKNTSFEFRLEVEDIAGVDAPAQPPSLNTKGQDVTLETLKVFGAKRNPFPTDREIIISVVHSKSLASDVLEDFYRQLRVIESMIEIRTVPADMTKSTEIAGAISKADGNVIALIRGGGEASDFSEFENFSVVSALAKKDAYRVLGIGHSRTATVLDLVCECSESTPSAAGTHIRDVAMRLFNDSISVRKLNEERDQLRSDIASLRQQHNALLSSMARERNSLREEFEHRQRRVYQIAAFVAVVCLMLGFLIAWKMLR